MKSTKVNSPTTFFILFYFIFFLRFSEWETHTSGQIVVERLTKNVNEDHLFEIFGQYGEIDDLDLPLNRQSESNLKHKLQEPTLCLDLTLTLT
jgi:hypothetical protein